MDERLRPHERLGEDRLFQQALQLGCRASDHRLVVHAAPNGLPYARLGIRVGRRVGNAAQRAYVRRRIREAFRRSKAELPVGVDLVFVARPPAADCDEDLATALRYLTTQAVRRLRRRAQPPPSSEGAG